MSGYVSKFGFFCCCTYFLTAFTSTVLNNLNNLNKRMEATLNRAIHNKDTNRDTRNNSLLLSQSTSSKNKRRMMAVAAVCALVWRAVFV